MGQGSLGQGLGVINAAWRAFDWTRRKLRGAYAAIRWWLLGLITIAALAGCGASAIQAQASAIRIAALAIESGSSTAIAAYSHEQAECADVECTYRVEREWAPVALAQQSAIAALTTWVNAVDVVRVAGDTPTLWRTVLAAIEELGRAWNAWVEAARGVGWTLPPLPPIVLEAVHAIGGEA